MLLNNLKNCTLEDIKSRESSESLNVIMSYRVRLESSDNLNQDNIGNSKECTRRVPFDKEGKLRYLPMMCPLLN